VTAVVSLYANPGTAAAAAEVIEAVGDRLQIEAHPALDGSWEFVFSGTYAQAHAVVAGALGDADPQWPAKVTLDYVLVV
jgi:hypothetical protein